MKRIALAIVIFLSINISNTWAEGNSTNASKNVRTIKSPRFARGLVEKWITEYEKTQPGVTFQIAKGNQNEGTVAKNQNSAWAFLYVRVCVCVCVEKIPL